MNPSVGQDILLRNGHSMPSIGFGSYQLADAHSSVLDALQGGYRHIDTARVYKNEADVGKAVAEAELKLKLPREILFVTSKVNARSHNLKETPKAVRQSLARTQLDYLDLYLLHDAISGPERRLAAWGCLIDAREKGLVKSVGVSNWNVHHLEELRMAGLELPMVNQIELHPWCQQRDLVAYCRSSGICIQAYCPLVRGERRSDRVLQSIVAETGHTWSQILLRWSLQKGYCPIVKSDSKARRAENLGVWDFSLNVNQMTSLDSLDQGKAGACSWNPIDCK